MSELSVTRFEVLPKVSETEPLQGIDLYNMAYWAAEKRGHKRELEAAAKKAGEDLDALWQGSPDILIGTLDEPNATESLPEFAIDVVSEFGLKVAQVSAYNRLYEQKVEALNKSLRNHFKVQDVTADIANQGRDNTGLGVGVFHLGHGGRSWGQRVNAVSGRVVDVNIDDASMWVRTPEGEDFGARFFKPNDEALGLYIHLHYPDQA